MAGDLRPFLDAWPYDPEHTIRMVRGADGKRRLQVRLPLGIEQYELDGRPDGRRPEGHESELARWERRLVDYSARHGSDEGLRIPSDACAELREEAVLYYYRYVLLFQVGEYGRTARDTSRNIRCANLVAHYGQTEEDRESMEPYRPYIVRMNRASRALLALERRQYDIALNEVEAGMRSIESLPERNEPTFGFEKKRSLAFLRQLKGEIRRKRPVSLRERLERRLNRAVREEAYELAARLRDRIAELDADPAPEKAERS